jgi:hypothetical protein
MVTPMNFLKSGRNAAKLQQNPERERGICANSMNASIGRGIGTHERGIVEFV